MAREELSWPACRHVVGQDGVDVGKRGDRSFVRPARHQQRLFPILDGPGKRGQVCKHGRRIVRGPVHVVLRISPTHPAGRKTIAALEPGNRSTDSISRNVVGVEAVAGEVEAGAEFGGDLLELGLSGRVEVGEPEFGS